MIPRPTILTALCLSLALLGCSEPTPPPEVIRPALVVHPKPAAESLYAYPGEVRARYEPALAFRIGGKITKRLVDVGSRVKENDPLAELDPQDTRLQLEAARAQMAAAEANLSLARGERERYKKLLDRQMISRSQYDTVENQYRASEARLQQMKAEFDVATNQTGYSVLRAPQTGVIAQRQAEVGQVVAAGQTVFTLAVNGEREVLFYVPERMIDQVRVGAEASIELWSQAGKELPGRVRELAPAADSQSRTFAARVAFAEQDVDVELGQSARVYIREKGEIPLSVPLSALTADNEQPYVWVVDPQTSRVMKRNVRIGTYGQQFASILEGLTAEDWVVEAGVHILQENQQVRPVDHENRSVELAQFEQGE